MTAPEFVRKTFQSIETSMVLAGIGPTMDMRQLLCEALAQGHTRFDSRLVFGKRVGKHTVFPIGLGSALAKAVRDGYLVVLSEGTRRRGKRYEMTSKLQPCECASNPASALSAPARPLAGHA